MREMNINGETYVKKSEIEIDSSIILENLKNGNVDFYEMKSILKEYIEDSLKDGEWFDYKQLVGRESSELLDMALIYRLL